MTAFGVSGMIMMAFDCSKLLTFSDNEALRVTNVSVVIVVNSARK